MANGRKPRSIAELVPPPNYNITKPPTHTVRFKLTTDDIENSDTEATFVVRKPQKYTTQAEGMPPASNSRPTLKTSNTPSINDNTSPTSSTSTSNSGGRRSDKLAIGRTTCEQHKSPSFDRSNLSSDCDSSRSIETIVPKTLTLDKIGNSFGSPIKNDYEKNEPDVRKLGCHSESRTPSSLTTNLKSELHSCKMQDDIDFMETVPAKSNSRLNNDEQSTASLVNRQNPYTGWSITRNFGPSSVTVTPLKNDQQLSNQSVHESTTTHLKPRHVAHNATSPHHPPTLGTVTSVSRQRPARERQHAHSHGRSTNNHRSALHECQTGRLTQSPTATTELITLRNTATDMRGNIRDNDLRNESILPTSSLEITESKATVYDNVQYFHM